MAHRYDDEEYHFRNAAEIYTNPYPFYQKLREKYPVHLDKYLGCWVVTTYDDVVAALANRDLSSERALGGAMLQQEGWKELQPLFADISNLMFFTDPPKHTRIRTLVNKAFSARMAETWRNRIQHVVDEQLDLVQDRGQMDVIQDLALRLPFQTIADMFGIPAQDQTQFKLWADDLAYFLGNPPTLENCRQLMLSIQDFMDYFREIVEQHRSSPTEDIVNVLLHARDHGVTLTEDELLLNCIGIFAGGQGTTTHLIGNGLLALLQNESQLRTLRQNPDLIEDAVEELLRYDSPAQFTARTCCKTTMIRNTKIYKGQKVMLLLGSANRDAQRFADPDRLDICRQDNRHLAFGNNIHYCVGSALARLQGQIAINTILQRMPQIQLASSPLQWQENLSFRGLKALPVTF